MTSGMLIKENSTPNAKKRAACSKETWVISNVPSTSLMNLEEEWNALPPPLGPMVFGVNTTAELCRLF